MGEIDHHLNAFIQEWTKCDHINQINFSNENFNRNELYYAWMQLCSCMKLTTHVIGDMDKIGLIKSLNVTRIWLYNEMNDMDAS